MEARRTLDDSPFSEPAASAGAMIAGIDEAGRGCLAGPVASAAVILDPDNPVSGLADSKSLSARKREELARKIKSRAIAWSVGLCWQKRIDEINILQATFEAMAKAVLTLKVKPSLLLIDGSFCIPDRLLAAWKDQVPGQEAIVRGDQSQACISAASILAKCFRDRLMLAFSRKWPNYAFDRHKGYGTKEHLKALELYGPCPLHRMTFKKVCPRDCN